LTRLIDWREATPVLEFTFDEPFAFSGLRLTSGNDVPARDPVELRLVDIDSGFGHTVSPYWSNRRQAIEMILPSPVSGVSRLRVYMVNGGDLMTQLSEWEFLSE
jgi:hypothetical protein